MIVLIGVLLGTFFFFWCISKLHVPFSSQFIILIMILIMGLRYNVGRDYPTYETIYNEPFSYPAMAVEPIWNFINDILRCIGFKSQIFFFLTSLVTLIGFYRGIKKMSPCFYTSLFLFFVSGVYFESSNIVRQYVAMSLLFCGFSDFLNKKWLHYLVWVLVAAIFHASVILIVPLILLSTYHYSKWVIGGIWIISFIMGNSVLNYLIVHFFPFLYDVGSYQYKVDDFDSGISSGMLRLFYNILALLMLILYSKYSFVDRKVYVLTNMFLLGIIIYNVCYIFMPARRLYLYFFPYLIVILPYYLKRFEKVSRWVVMSSICAVFLAFLLKSNIGLQYDCNLIFF